MSGDDRVTQDIGLAEQVTMDDFMRTLIGQMFENVNDTATLEVVLNGTDSDSPPRIELEIKLTSINGVKTRPDTDE